MFTNTTIYLAPRGYTEDLIHELQELTSIVEVRGRLVVAKGSPLPVAWAQNVWQTPETIAIESIGDAAKKLKAIQRNWCLHTEAHHRRAKLIQEKLPYVSAKPLAFGQRPPEGELGSWTLWEPNLIVASARCSSPFPNGEVLFLEDKETPPTRAYLKLWELFTLLEVRPKDGELCLDLGSCPGGWTWVLAEMGAKVFSIDKAPLASHIASHPNVHFCAGSAFGLDPRHAGKVDWLFSDVICYPERLLALVKRWLATGQCRNFVCTIKFQHETDHTVAKEFASIPGSRLLHLSCNKHELTWVKLANQ